MSNQAAVAPSTAADFLALVRKSGVLDEKRFEELFPTADDLPDDAQKTAVALIRAGLLTAFQAKSLLAGKFRGFLLGAYRILEPLGKGGMGTVFLGEHATLKRKVALKVLPTDKALNKLTLERFYREARAVAALDHPNIVRLHDISQGGGVHFLVMEYVEGNDLQSLMAKTGPLHYAQAAHYIAQAAAGLQHAHDKGFVHRDVKPANLILAKDGTIKILDMGLARSFTDEGDDLTGQLGDSSDVAGTADYIAPEQAMSQPVDERSDIYSLGATLFALVTGHPPFKGTTAQKLMQHQLKEPPSLLKLKGVIPPALSEVVARMMAKKPSERFQSAADVIDALGPWLPAPTTGNIAQDPFRTADLQAAGISLRGSGTASMVAAIKPNTDAPLSGPAPAKGFFTGPVKWAAGGLAASVLLVGGLIGYLASGDNKPQPNLAAVPPVTPAPTPTPRTTTPPRNNPPPAPRVTPVATRIPGTVVLDADLTAAPPFSARVRQDRSESGKTGDWPAGWKGFPWNPDSEVEYFVGRADGRSAIGMRPTQGPSSGMLLSPRFATPAGRCKVRVEYQAEAAEMIVKFLPLEPEMKMAFEVTRLPATGGQWATREADLDVPPGTGGIIEFHHGSTAADGAIRVRRLTVTEPSAAPAGTGKVIYKLDPAGLKPFAERGRAVPDPNNNRNKLWEPGTRTGGPPPEKWTGRTWNFRSEGEWTVAEVDGQPAIGLWTPSGPGSMMVFTPPFDCPDRRCVLTFEYKTEAGANSCQVRFKPEKPTRAAAWDVAKLPSTDGRWSAERFEVDLRDATGGYFEFHNNSAGGPWMWLRAVTIAEPGPAEAVVHAADLSAVPPFRITKGNGGSGQAPQLPPGWRMDVFNKETLAEFRAEVDGGRTVLSAAHVSGPRASQWTFDPQHAGYTLQPGRPYEFRIEYRVDDGLTGYLFAQSVGDWKGLADRVRLEGGAGWQTASIIIQVADGQKAQVTFGPDQAVPGKFVYLRSLELIDRGAGTTAAAPTRPRPNRTTPVSRPQPAAPGGLPYRLDLRTPFTVFKEWKDGALVTDGTVELPGFALADPADGTGAELSVTEIDGKLTLGLRKLEGAGAVEAGHRSPVATLRPGRRYRLRFEYRGEDGAVGLAEVRSGSGPATGPAGQLSLGTTGGRWEWRELDVAPTAELPAVLVFQNRSPGSANGMYFRSVELVEAGG